MENGFRTIESINSSNQHIIKIEYQNKCFGIVNTEHGLDKAEIEIKNNSFNQTIWRFDYEIFIKCLRLGFERLKQANQGID